MKTLSKLSKTTVKTAAKFGLWVNTEFQEEIHSSKETECLVIGSEKYDGECLFIYRIDLNGGWVYESSILQTLRFDIKEEMPHHIENEKVLRQVLKFLGSVNASTCLD